MNKKIGWFIEQLRAELEQPETKIKIKSRDLENLGYQFSGKDLCFSQPETRTVRYLLKEVVDRDTRVPADFCFLLLMNENRGIILNQPFKYFHSRMI